MCKRNVAILNGVAVVRQLVSILHCGLKLTCTVCSATWHINKHMAMQPHETDTTPSLGLEDTIAACNYIFF